jgi:hypothetical protein
MNCAECQIFCCNHLVAEMRNGCVSISYVIRRLEAGDSADTVLDRLKDQHQRIETALKNCRRKEEDI